MKNQAIPLVTALILAASPFPACKGTVTFGDEDADTSTDTSPDTGGDGMDTGEDALPDTATDSPSDSPMDTDDVDGDAPVDIPPDEGATTDGDGDTISDADEGSGTVDTDSDGTPDTEDLDSDGDGFDDSEEAGDADISTPPDDCDSDGIPSFQDRDSDSDGLGDLAEHAHLTDPCDPDSDSDGVSDLLEVAYGSDPTDPDDNPGAVGDFVFEMPYGQPPSPAFNTLVFSTNLKVADVFFLMDTTGSMGSAIASLKTDISSIITGIRGVVPDSWFGVGRFDDYPVSPYGGAGDVVFLLHQRMTGDTAVVQAAVNALDLDGGGDYPEAHVPALWATATGNGMGAYLSPQLACGPAEVGYPCFRTTSIPIVILVTDAAFHNGPSSYSPYGPTISPLPPTYSEAVTALNAINARVVSIYSLGYDPGAPVLAQVTQLANDTGAVDGAGSPLVFLMDTAGFGDQVVGAVETLATAVPIRVDAIAADDTSDMIDAVAEFVQSIHTNVSGASIWDPILGELRPGTSGIPTATPSTPPSIDYFSVVDPGISVCFDIVPRTNTTIPATSVPLVFKAVINVVGDTYMPLDTRDVYFVVPPIS